jgi:hypothetical protein
MKADRKRSRSLLLVVMLAWLAMACTKREPPPPAIVAGERVDYAKEMDKDIESYQKKLARENRAREGNADASYRSDNSYYDDSPSIANHEQYASQRGLNVLVLIMGKSEFVNKAESLCSPTGTSFGPAAQAWRVRNAEVLGKAQVVISSQLEAADRRAVDAMLVKISQDLSNRLVPAQTNNERTQQCHRLATSIERQEHDVAPLKDALEGFTPAGRQ